MDNYTDFERVLEGMRWEEVADALRAAEEELLETSPQPPTPPSRSPPAEPGPFGLQTLTPGRRRERTEKETAKTEMDNYTDFERVLEGMRWEEVADTLLAAEEELLETSTPPPTPPSRSPPAELGPFGLQTLTPGRRRERTEKETAKTETDNYTDFERVLEGMRWEEVVDTLRAAEEELLETSPQPPTPPPTPPSRSPPAEPGPFGLQTLTPGRRRERTEKETAKTEMDNTDFERVLEGMRWEEVVDTLRAAEEELLETSPQPPTPPSRSPPAEPGPFGLQHYFSPGQGLTPVGLMDGDVVYGLPPTYSDPVATPLPQERKRGAESHIKKPPNAFMVFRAEQRPQVVAELGTADGAVVNRVLGQRWKSLPKEQQVIYYEEADREKLVHSLLYPDWTARDNYGKKRRTRKASTRAEAFYPY